jgi:hypothetical protein
LKAYGTATTFSEPVFEMAANQGPNYQLSFSERQRSFLTFLLSTEVGRFFFAK